VRGPLVVVGDALLDVDVEGRATRLCPDAPVPVIEDAQEHSRPGGAALAAALAAGDGHEVVLVSPLGDDEAARRLLRVLPSSVRVIPIPTHGATAVKRRIRAAGQTLVRLDSGDAAATIGAVPTDAAEALASASAVLVADYGRGSTGSPRLRDLLAGCVGRAPVVWDPHPRGHLPVPGVRLVTPNIAEVQTWAAQHGVRVDSGSSSLAALTSLACGLVAAWGSQALSVTRGDKGALLTYGSGAPVVVPAPHISGGDACGAGDRFASAAAVALGSGMVTAEAVQAAVDSASAFVAAGGAGAWGRATAAHPVAPPDTARDAAAVAAAVRATGGVVVATGGCFDLLHAGHIATLRAARELGDCLVVCLNSDDSVRRLKGPSRPLVPAADRARVLAALACVDAVVVFDEDTPDAVLRRLQPHVWAKGGDYAGAELPEAQTLRTWGGQAVVLPYVEGRSTSALVRSAATPNPMTSTPRETPR